MKQSYTIPVFFSIRSKSKKEARERLIAILEAVEWDEPDIDTVCVGNKSEVRISTDT